MQEQEAFEDLYEILQLSPNADFETVERVYRILAKRFHPDNLETGSTERFSKLSHAYSVLSDPEKRAAYDVKYSEAQSMTWKIFDESSASDSFEDDRRVLQGVLSLLYVARRRDAGNAGIGVVELERMLSCPAEHLEFHLWYLKEKGWIERLMNGQWAISAEGVDEVVRGDLMLRRDHLLARGNFQAESKDRKKDESRTGLKLGKGREQGPTEEEQEAERTA